MTLFFQAGAPLMASSIQTLPDGTPQPVAVVDGMHAVNGGVHPGTVRYANHPDTNLAMSQVETSQMQPAGGCRYTCCVNAAHRL